MTEYETVIGLEIHVELKTKSKIFCSCSTKFGDLPNKNICPICLGLPGTMPSLNKEVVNLAVKAGLALNCNINNISETDRKNYFYPDLPKAYQITQFDMPICTDGYLKILKSERNRKISIERIHIEEDSGKLIHDEEDNKTLIDYNRSGVPLIEIVTKPDIRSEDEAVEFLKDLKNILIYTDVSDCKMSEGSLRCDANISIREIGSNKLNTKVEIKNLNSFKEIYKALKMEKNRQIDLYKNENEKDIIQETLRWDENIKANISMRSKEDPVNYRFFPEPDLAPIIVREEEIEEIKKTIPELPREKKDRFIKEYNLNEKSVEILVENRRLGIFFEELVRETEDAEESYNWIKTQVMRSLKNYKEIPVTSKQLGNLIEQIKLGNLSKNAGKKVFNEMCESKKMPEEIIGELGLRQINEKDKLEELVSGILEINRQAVKDYNEGKDRAFGFLIGEIMKKSKGKANPKLVKKLLEEKLM